MIGRTTKFLGVKTLGAALLLSLGLGCSSVYYSAWEKLGYEKRDILKSKIEGVRSQQEEVSEQFEDSLERLVSLYGSDDTPLEDAYREVKGDYDRSVREADTLRSRVKTAEQVARDLFDEWGEEIEQLKNPKFRNESSRKLSQTRNRFEELDRALRRSTDRIDPVLEELKDHTLYLKHNLNAQVIGRLERTEMRDIEREVGLLVADMQEAIRKADDFIDALEEG
jgi:gas vesicle protein